MSQPEYVQIECKSALNRVQGMPFRWSLNPYVGCVHACHYCYARAYYAIAERGNADRDFETRVFVKANMPGVLARELARPSWMRDLVALGTSTDCYQPAEARFRVTRGLLEALVAHGNPASVVTKAPLVLRDLDLWSDLARVARARVYFTITTLDRALWRQIEPGTPHPRQRLAAVARLNAAGVPAGVLLAPVLPGITDREGAIEEVAAAAAEHGAISFGSAPLRLAPVVKEHYLGFVGEAFPQLLPRYRQAYPGTYAPADYRARLEARLARVRAEHGFANGSLRADDPEASPIRPRMPPVAAPRQLALALA